MNKDRVALALGVGCMSILVGVGIGNAFVEPDVVLEPLLKDMLMCAAFTVLGRYGLGKGK